MQISSSTKQAAYETFNHLSATAANAAVGGITGASLSALGLFPYCSIELATNFILKGKFTTTFMDPAHVVNAAIMCTIAPLFFEIGKSIESDEKGISFFYKRITLPIPKIAQRTLEPFACIGSIGAYFLAVKNISSQLGYVSKDITIAPTHALTTILLGLGVVNFSLDVFASIQNSQKQAETSTTIKIENT